MEKHNNNKLNFTKQQEKYLFIKPYYRDNDELLEFIEENIEGDYIEYGDLDIGDKITVDSYLQDIKDEYGSISLKLYRVKDIEKNKNFIHDPITKKKKEFTILMLEENSGFIFANQNYLFIWLSLARGVSDDEFKNGDVRVAEYYFHLRSYFQLYDENVFEMNNRWDSFERSVEVIDYMNIDLVM